MKLLAAIRANLYTVWTIALLEMRFDVRLLRTWFFVAFALLIGVTNAFEQISVYSELSAVSSGTFMHSPLLSPITIFPDFQVVITFGLVFFAIEIVSRDRSARIDEVIGSLPIRNNQIVFGRALGLTALLFLLFAAFLCLYVLVAVFCELALPHLGIRPPEPYSMLATLFTDALPYLFFWTAVAMFLTVSARNRVLAAVLAIALMLLMYWLQNNMPMYLLNVLGTYSLSTQLPSEVAPVFASSAIVIHRVALVLLAVALLLWAAFLLPRLNTDRTRKPTVIASSFSVLAVIGFSVVHAHTFAEIDELDSWRELHALYKDTPQIDIERLSGQVALDPGSEIAIDLTVDFILPQHLASGVALVFSLNPGYEIEKLSLDDHAVAYSFEGGLLRVEAPRRFESNEQMSLTVEATGDPDPRFAYLDTAIDPLTTDAVSGYGLFLLGSEEAINHSDYVALLPGVAWYPMAGPHLDRESISQRPRDYFDVAFEVLTPHEWHTAGPGKSNVQSSSEGTLHVFRPKIPIHEIGVFAAAFERRTKMIGGIDFELLVSPKHTANLDLFKPILDDIAADIEERIEFARARGFEFPFDIYSIVETPTYLRTFGGGWQMPSIQSLPGVFLLREGMFLSADFRSIEEAVRQDAESTDEEKSERLVTLLTRYFENEVTGGNVSHALVDNFVQFRAAPTGLRAEWLAFLIDYLTTEVISQSSGFYSVENLKTIGTWITARLGAWNIDAERTRETLNEIYFNEYIDRPEVWEFMFDRSLSEGARASSSRNRLHAGFLYSKTMGDLILDLYGAESVASLLATLVDRYQGVTFTFTDFNAVATELDMPLQENFGDWLNDIQPAGFVASTFEAVRLPDASDGSPVYEHSLHVQNRESNAGVFQVAYESMSAESPPVYVLQTIQPIELDGNSSIQIAIQTKAPIEKMLIEPYFSLNRKRFEVESAGGAPIAGVSREPAPLVKPSDWTWEFNDRIYVDDLDPGFSVDPPEIDSTPLFTIRMITFGQADPEMASRDQGLRVYDGYSNGSTTEWARQVVDSSFGLYRRTLVRAEHNSTPQRVHFRTNLPDAGFWNLHYHLPNINDPRDNLFDTRGRERFSSGGGVSRPDLDISVAQADNVRPVVAEGNDLVTGWNQIGRFELDSSEVTVSVSTQTASGTVIADAIYWEPVGSSHL